MKEGPCCYLNCLSQYRPSSVSAGEVFRRLEHICHLWRLKWWHICKFIMPKVYEVTKIQIIAVPRTCNPTVKIRSETQFSINSSPPTPRRKKINRQTPLVLLPSFRKRMYLWSTFSERKCKLSKDRSPRWIKVYDLHRRLCKNQPGIYHSTKRKAVFLFV